MTGLFLPLDVNYYHDEEFLIAGPYAELLYVRANCWIKANRTDGKIARAQLVLFAVGIPNPKRHADALVDQKLWVETKAGWTVPAYLKRNRSKAQIEASRDIASEAGLRGAHERWHVPPEGAPSPKCPICIGERMGSPHRIAIGSDSHREDIERDIEKTEPETEPQREPKREKSSSSVLTAVPDHPGQDDDDDFETVLAQVITAKELEYKPRKPRAWRLAVRQNLIAEDGDIIRTELANGLNPEHVALMILGYGTEATKERTEIPWCTNDCPHCRGDGWVHEPQGLAPCPNRATA